MPIIPKKNISRKTRKLPQRKPFLIAGTDSADQTLCQVDWLNISAEAMAMKRVIAAVSPSTVQLLATANSSLEIRFSGLAVAAMRMMNTRKNIKMPWNLSVVMEAGRPARDV
jgi:hypothetical protein